MGLSHSPRIVTNGLVGCWDAGNPKSYPRSGTTWTDLSGQGNTGTLRNSTTYSSVNLGKFVLDGVNQDIDCGNNASINFDTGDFTVSIWFRRFTNVTNNLRVLSKAGSNDTADATGAGFSFYGDDASLTFTVNPTGTRTFLGGAGQFDISLNQWYNAVGLVQRGVSMRLYKNGDSGITTTAPVGSVSGSTSLYLGSNRGLNLYWPGEISNVSLYNRALSDSEIKQNFNALRGRFGV